MHHPLLLFHVSFGGHSNRFKLASVYDPASTETVILLAI